MNYFQMESERLRFRKLTISDIPKWTEFFTDNENLEYLGLDLSKTKDELAAFWIKKQFIRYEEQNLGHLAVETKDNGSFIGMGGILIQDVEGKPEFEIAYSLLPKFWGKGYGTEIARQLKLYGLENLKAERFVSVIDIRNQKSIHVALKNGMQKLFRTSFHNLTVDVYGIENSNH